MVLLASLQERAKDNWNATKLLSPLAWAIGEETLSGKFKTNIYSLTIVLHVCHVEREGIFGYDPFERRFNQMDQKRKGELKQQLRWR